MIPFFSLYFDLHPGVFERGLPYAGRQIISREYDTKRVNNLQIEMVMYLFHCTVLLIPEYVKHAGIEIAGNGCFPRWSHVETFFHF